MSEPEQATAHTSQPPTTTAALHVCDCVDRGGSIHHRARLFVWAWLWLWLTWSRAEGNHVAAGSPPASLRLADRNLNHAGGPGPDPRHLPGLWNGLWHAPANRFDSVDGSNRNRQGAGLGVWSNPSVDRSVSNRSTKDPSNGSSFLHTQHPTHRRASRRGRRGRSSSSG